MEEIYSKVIIIWDHQYINTKKFQACESRDWTLTRLTAGLLNKRLEELGKAVTHLLVRQKQITVSLEGGENLKVP